MMISKNIRGFLSLLRLSNCFISFFSVFIVVLLMSKIGGIIYTSFFFKTFLAALAVFLITGGGNAVNDYYDAEIDKINKPKRPIPSKIITKKQALYFTFALFSVGLVLSFFVNVYAFFVALVNIVILTIYSKLKQKTILGNFVVAYLCGSVFLYAGTILMSGFDLVVKLFLLSFFAMLGREITKDIEDIAGDSKRKKTIATQFSAKHAGALGALTLGTSIIISLGLMEYFGKLYVLAIFFADTVLFYCIIRLLFNPVKYAPECQRLEKLAVIIMLAGIFACAL